MKPILCIFEQLSGLQINFHKSEIFCFGKANELQDQYTENFGCEVGALPFRYLGIPIHHRKLLNKEWNPAENRFENKLGCWQGKLLSYGDRLAQYLLACLCLCYPSLRYLKGSSRGWISFGHDFSGKAINTNESTD